MLSAFYFQLSSTKFLNSLKKEIAKSKQVSNPGHSNKKSYALPLEPRPLTAHLCRVGATLSQEVLSTRQLI